MPPPGLCLVILGMVSGTPPEVVSLDLEGKVETLVGTNLSPGVPPGTVSTLFNFTPGVVLKDLSQTGQLKLSYTPLLYFFVPSGVFPSELLVLNRFTYEATNALSRTVSLSLTGALWFGDVNYSPVVSLGAPPGTGTGQPPGTVLPPGQLPQVQLIRVLTSSTQLSLGLITSSTVVVTLAAGFLYSEGTNAASRLELPLQRGPYLLARSDVQLNERDTLTPALRVGLLSYGPIFQTGGAGTENGSTVVIPHFQEGLNLFGTELTLKWGHQEGRELHTEFAAGAALFNESSSYDVITDQGPLLWYSRSSLVPANTFVDPIVRATLLYRVNPEEEQPLVLGAFAALAPVINQFQGTVYERVEASLSADWGPSPTLRLSAFAALADSFSPQELDVRGEVRAVWTPATSVALALGGRVAWVNYAIPSTFNGFSWTVFFSITGATGALF